MKRGITFSGYCQGPKLLDERVMSTGTRWVCQYASATRSPPAFEAEYGFEGRRGSVSRDAPRSTEPYTSSVEMWTRRGILRSLTVSSSVWTPKTSVRRNSSGSMIDRSTWVIAAKLITASTPRATSRTRFASQMSPWTNV